MSYLRLAAMVGTSMVLMYAISYLNSAELDHVRWSETRLFMILIMGATMALVMLGFMVGMYRNLRINLMITAACLLCFVLATWLMRGQTTVEDTSYMSAMIPHHSIAILTSERVQISDVRVCRLAVEIIEAQRREITEMEWLLEDIERHGPAETEAAAAQRPVPEVEGSSDRSCD